jgi:hypothetical protein
MKKWVFIGLLILGATLTGLYVNGYFSEQNAAYTSLNPNAAYFYPLDTIPKIYHYRDIANGLDEEFHRIYTVEDALGPHLIVEVYAADGRLREAINFNIDSLVVQDHMVVNRLQSKEKATLYKNQLFPFDLQKEAWFASKFSGVTDSTLILNEVLRNFQAKKPTVFLANQKAEALYFKDLIRRTVLNPYTRKEKEVRGYQTSIYAKGYGLVAWHNRNKTIHYRLERVLTQKEWIKIIAR